jgi:hypothetical protein
LFGSFINSVFVENGKKEFSAATNKTSTSGVIGKPTNAAAESNAESEKNSDINMFAQDALFGSSSPSSSAKSHAGGDDGVWPANAASAKGKNVAIEELLEQQQQQQQLMPDDHRGSDDSAAAGDGSGGGGGGGGGVPMQGWNELGTEEEIGSPGQPGITLSETLLRFDPDFLDSGGGGGALENSYESSPVVERIALTPKSKLPPGSGSRKVVLVWFI